MSDAQDELIRNRAYAIWQAEGCPHDRQDQHWRQAAAELAQAQDESAQRDEPVLATEAIVDPLPEATPEPAAPDAAKPAPARRARKVADVGAPEPKARRKKSG